MHRYRRIVGIAIKLNREKIYNIELGQAVRQAGKLLGRQKRKGDSGVSL